MIRIDNSEQVDTRFALSQCEVESRHFQQFVSETGFIDSAPHEPSEAAAVADVLSELPKNTFRGTPVRHSAIGSARKKV